MKLISVLNQLIKPISRRFCGHCKGQKLSLWRTKRVASGESLDVSETLKAHGGFFNPTIVSIKGDSGSYEVSLRTDAKSNKNTLINIYGIDQKKDASKLTFHQHYFGSYQKDAKSPVMQGYLHTVKSTLNPLTVTVQGHMKFFYKTEIDKENSLYVYFGNNDKNGNNGGIVFDQNNVARSGQLRISCQDPNQGYNKTYNIEGLTENERAELKKLNLLPLQ